MVRSDAIQYGICGARRCLELFNRFQRETGVKILEGYGLTEGGCVSTLNPPAGATTPAQLASGCRGSAYGR